MKRILVTGALGQIGSELTLTLRERYGEDKVVACDIRAPEAGSAMAEGHYGQFDCTDPELMARCVREHDVGTIYHLAALLSATAEAKPILAWKVNMDGLFATLEVAREHGCAVFTPSSIGAFGPSTPAAGTPQDTIQRPTSMYGVTKVAGELLCDYYFKRFGVDTRGLRYPGIISNVTLPGGGTTDYAVEIYYEAIKKGRYTCFLGEATRLDMMYMPDAIAAAIGLMEASPHKLVHRNAFNVSAMSVTPRDIAASIHKHIPSFVIDYNVDPVRQGIADSWPDWMDDSAARAQWGWEPEYDLDAMTSDMLKVLGERHERGQL